MNSTDLTFAIPEDAIQVPLAITDLAGARFVNIIPGATDQPDHGSLSVVSNIVYYTPNANFTGSDSFEVRLTDSTGATSISTINLDVRASHEQPQTTIDSDIAPEISPSGESVILRKVADLPTGVTGAEARMNQVISHKGDLYISTDGSVTGEGEIYKLTADGAGGYDTQLWFDVGSAVASSTGRNLNNESPAHGGLRSLAFHPEFETNGKIYTTVMEDRPTNPTSSQFTYISDVDNPIAADSVLVEWTVNPATGVVDAGSYREVFRVAMPVYDHPIKQITFNPYAVAGDADYGLLYIGHGDGSVQSAIAGGGQNADGLGKILRVNPLQSGVDSYSVPADNPFVGNASMIDEAYAIGFRNPHNLNFSIDANGDVSLIAADIGRDNFDELNIVVSGGNYGWSDREGPLVHLSTGGVVNGVRPLDANDGGGNFIYPAAFYAHQGELGGGFVGQAIAGGVVAGGELLDQVIFGDFANDGRLFHVSLDDLKAADTSFTAGEAPADALSWATPSELTVLYDHDANANTVPVVQGNIKDIFGTTRSDVRFGTGPDGEVLIINKRDGSVYSVDNSREQSDPFFQQSPGSPIVVSPGQTITGTEGNDNLYGSLGDDVITTLGGVDVVNGSAGSDRIIGDQASYDQIDYDGNFADYAFTENHDGTISVAKPFRDVDTLSDIDGFWFKGEQVWKPVEEITSNTGGGGTGNTYQDTPGETQYLTAQGDGVFVFNSPVSGYAWDNTLDGQGIVVWNTADNSFDILFGFSTLRFADGEFPLNGPTVPDPNLFTNNPFETQYLTADGDGVFVFDSPAAGYSWDFTEDRQGVVVWNTADNSFDILYGFSTLRFADGDHSLEGFTNPPENRVADNPYVTQYLTGTTDHDTFVIDAPVAGNAWDRTEDGQGIVVWDTTDGSFDILFQFEELEFQDAEFGI